MNVLKGWCGRVQMECFFKRCARAGVLQNPDRLKAVGPTLHFHAA